MVPSPFSFGGVKEFRRAESYKESVRTRVQFPAPPPFSGVADWIGVGLQIHRRGFDSLHHFHHLPNNPPKHASIGRFGGGAFAPKAIQDKHLGPKVSQNIS